MHRGRGLPSPRGLAEGELHLLAAGQDPAGLRHFTELEAEWIEQPQPFRTDLEAMMAGQGWVDVEIEAVE